MKFQLFRSLKSLKQKLGGSYLGLDIGTTSIKVVEVSARDDRPAITNYGILDSESALGREHSAFQTSKLKLFEGEIKGFLRTLLEKVGPKTTNVVASFPLFSAFTTVLSFPKMSEEDLEKAILFQARQYVPLPLSEVALDWKKIEEREDEKGRQRTFVFLTSVPQEHVKKYQEICKDAGLTLTALEIESMSLVRAFVGEESPPTYIIDIGSRSTGIAIAEKGMLKFTAQTDFAGSSLTHAVASSLNINPFRAEELKKERGIIGTGPNRELSTIMLPFLDAIITEVKRADFTYRSQFPHASPIEQAIVTGGGANLLGIEKYVSEQLGVTTVKASPFGRFNYPHTLDPLVPELSALLGVGLGLTLRQVLEIKN